MEALGLFTDPCQEALVEQRFICNYQSVRGGFVAMAVHSRERIKLKNK